MHSASYWFARKLREPSATIAEPRTVAREFNRFTGRLNFAAVTLTLTPADELSVRFNCEPSEPDYRWAIEDAIYAELLGHYRQPILRLSIVVDAVREDAIGSSYVSFKMATIEAMKEGLCKANGGTNIVWR